MEVFPTNERESTGKDTSSQGTIQTTRTFEYANPKKR